MNKSLYPANWKEIRARIQQRAGDKCELCGVANHEVGVRDKAGNWYDHKSIDNLNSDIGYSLFGEYPKIIRIVCTTMHLDHDTQNNVDDNLKFACQRCHNRHDIQYRQAHAQETRRQNRLAKTGQMELF